VGRAGPRRAVGVSRGPASRSRHPWDHLPWVPLDRMPIR
jgi:hypothetical protein